MVNSHLAEAKGLIAGCVNQPAAAVADDAAIGTLEGWDSIAHISIVLAIEARVGRNLTSDEIIAVTGVVSVADILKQADGP